MNYVGIDWATKVHACTVMDEDGCVTRRVDIPHTPKGIAQLHALLHDCGGPDDVRVGMESGTMLLLDQLLVHGYTVYVLNPRQADRFRDRFSPAGAKDDRRDADVLASAVRTDHERLRQARPDSPLTVELRERVRARHRLVGHRTRLLQQLRAVLQESHPAMLEALPNLSKRFAWSLLEAYPSMAAARRARRDKLRRLLREHRVRRLDADALKAVLAAPDWEIDDGRAAAVTDEILGLVEMLRTTRKRLDRAEARIEELAAAHPDIARIRELPGVGMHLAPQILGEIGDAEERRARPDALSTYAGTAPVTRSSGTRKIREGRRGGSFQVRMRRGCNRRLQHALWLMARLSLGKSRWARAYVDWRLSKGHAYNTVMRALSLKWTKIIAHLLATGQHYDEDLHIRHLRRAGVPWAKNIEETTP